MIEHVLFGIFISSVIGDSNKCGTKLLNDYEKVPDSAFKASSHFIHPDPLKKKADFSAKAARESYDKENQEFAWCPLNQVETSLSEYLEIDLGRLTLVKVVQTKGRFAQGAGKEFTPFYRIRYTRDLENHWRDYKKFKDKGFREILNGPNDAFLDVFETLDPPIVARRIRIFPYSHKPKRVCMKLQLFGCDFASNLLEYEVLQGTPAAIKNSILTSESSKSFSDLIYPCQDNSYDGQYYGGLLKGGLGLLTDNAIWENLANKTIDLLYFVGWHKNSYDGIKEFITIKFMFLNSRNFSSLKVFSYKNIDMRVNYFSQIHISFSEDGKLFNRPIVNRDLLSSFVDNDFSINVNLKGHHGRYVKVDFYFESIWLLLSEVSFTSESSHVEGTDNSEGHRNNGLSKNDSASLGTVTAKSNNVNDFDITTSLSKYKDKSISLEIIYLLTILLCLLLGVITAICSFWVIIKRKKSQRKKVIKKQALALCSQSSFIPYNHNSNSLQCLASTIPPVTMQSRGNYPAYTMDRRNYPNGTLRTVTNLTGGYHSHSSVLDQNGMTNKYCNGDTNVYTSIVGSDNDSSLSPEYATTSVTNDIIYPQTYLETPTSYLPAPIEPIRSNGYSDPCRSNSDRQSVYFSHHNTLSSPQDSVNTWRINGIGNIDLEYSYNPPDQFSFNDFSYLKYTHTNLQDNYDSNTSSKYSELPCINSHL